MFYLIPPEFIYGKKLKVWYRLVMSDGSLPRNWSERPRIRFRSEVALAAALTRLYTPSNRYINNEGWIVRKHG